MYGLVRSLLAEPRPPRPPARTWRDWALVVRVTANDQSVHPRVSDDGDPTSTRPTAPGYGLIGMRERADLLGGTCQAGPGADRGWTVTAPLPRTGSAA